MNVSLTPELEQYVAAKVQTGLYGSASEVVREALRALREKEEQAEKKAAMLAELQVGMEDLKAGRTRKASAREILDGVRKKKNKK